ncbi:hypothetical protein AGMMS49546_26330 [Spirochaetia bacterium]|nr:hypothetical protein AGMMS49546_26330 [Spirochaetia bacterium]
MDFEHFSISRDLFYLSGAFMGLVFGYMFGLFRHYITAPSRNRRITLLFCLLSGALGSLALSLIYSRGLILHASSLFIPTGICVLVFALAVCFPRAVACPLILLTGILVVWIGYSFLRLPPAEASSVPLLSLYNDGEGVFSVRSPGSETADSGDRARPKDRVVGSGAQKGDRAEAVPIRIIGNSGVLEFHGTIISVDPRYPIIGSMVRGTITAIRQNNESFFEKSPLNEPLLKAYYSRPAHGTNSRRLGFTIGNYESTFPADTIPPGKTLAVLFNGRSLVFKPSWPVGH